MNVVCGFNDLLDKGGNMLLLDRVLVVPDVLKGRWLLLFPVITPFPFVLFPFSLVPRLLYSLAILTRFWRGSVRLKPISARYVAGVLARRVAK
jgi:hypothetical protein